MTLSLDIKAGILLSCALGLHWLKHRRDSRHLPLPPGPKKLPILGSLLELPDSYEWVAYHEWCKQYETDILHVDLMGSSVIVLDSYEAATELLEKRSAIYSSRARQVMTNELMGWDFHFVTMAYGDRWRKHRRLMQQAFNSTASLRYRPHELQATHHFLRRLLDQPDDILTELRQLAGETIVGITYGLAVLEKNDPYIEAAERGFRPFSVALNPSQFWVNFAPGLKHLPEWLPGMGFLTKAKEWKKWTMAMINFPFDAMKNSMSEGDAPAAFASDALQRIDPNADDRELQEYTIKSTAATMYAAGSDTTVSVISSCILGLLEHPAVLAKAQQHMDEVAGDRLPTFEDMDKLPYITAIVKETMRWRDVVPIGVPHYIEVEDEYKGYRIPAGSTIIANAWAMLHDPSTYPEPFDFKPERFMTKDGTIDLTVKDPDFAVWGFGRRICPGRHMAFSAAWIAIASLIAAFDIKKAVDKEGKTIELSHKYDPSVVMMPLPFKCAITPRSRKAEELVRATLDS